MSRSPRISFVSLGCPKALVDSERIITRLRAEGYELTRDHADSDLAIVNTCGFLDSAQAESLSAIGAALKENGKVIVTGCMGAEPEKITAAHPNVLAVTGPQQYESVLAAVHQAAPPQHDPYTDLIPPEGIKLTPRHYAYLKISEGCNNRCTFCIIPHLRGDLVSRPAADVLREAERLVAAGVKELLVISQDTSAYGVRPEIRSQRLERPRSAGEIPRLGARARRLRRLGAAALRVPLPACRPGHSAHGGRPCAALSRRAVSTRQSGRAQTHATTGGAGRNAVAYPAVAIDLPKPRHPLDLHRRLSRRDRGGFRAAAGVAQRGRARPSSAASVTSPSPAPPPTAWGPPSPTTSRKSAGTASCRLSKASPPSA